MNALEESPTPEWEALAKKLNSKTPKELEGASTVIYFEKAGLKEEALKKQFPAIKPQLTQDFDTAAASAASFGAA